MNLRPLPRLFIWLAVFSLSPSLSAQPFHDRYDSRIQAAANRYLPGVDWRLLKAQLHQESRLEPAAVSPVGARGVAQFMPGTWSDVSRQLGWGTVSPHVADYAIEAGAFYMSRLRDNWSAPRPVADRYSLALASYNAGLGNLLQAQQRCGGRNLYGEIIECLPEVTGHYSRETITYVRRIWKYWQAMVLGF